MSIPSAPRSRALGDLIAEADKLDDALAQNALEVSLFFLRNVTMEGLEPYLRFRLLKRGIRPSLRFGGYGSIRQDLVEAQSLAAAYQPDVVVLCLMLEELDPSYGLPGWTGANARSELAELFDAVAASGAPTVVVNTFVPPFLSEAGFQPPKTAPNMGDEVASLNQFVRQYVRAHSPRFCLADWERLARQYGEAESMDYRYWYMAKAPFKKLFLDGIAHELAKIVLALKGQSKKCLVLDCDNTLWGGVVGEDGIDGIRLDGHDYPGKAYYDFQKAVLQLAERGVLVVLCSKNNEADVLEVLDKHPWSLVKRSHLSGYRVNWKDKATNIEALARELNLGLDSFVYVDDNPAELELVSQALPEVTSLLVPQRLYDYPALLLRDGWFDTLSIGQEDRQRAVLYQGEDRRKAERNRFVNIDAYLASLQMEADIHPANDGEVERVAQLSQKTNQFNLTTRRYSVHDIEVLRTGADSAVFTLTARDRFGGLGLIGVLILKRENERAFVDTLLMSCRALGRGLETAFMLDCMEQARQRWSVREWCAEYIPTIKNGQVASFWNAFGFTPASQDHGVCRYRLMAPAADKQMPGYLKIRR